MFNSIEEAQSAMEGAQYITDRPMATLLYLSLKLGKPILVEGEAGVGKTEIAKVLAQILETKLIRLQCYEGLDVNTSLYEWNYPKQILWMKQAEICEAPQQALVKEIFSPEFLIQRPLLEAIQSDSPKPPVLLIDEIDRSDEEFEAFLLEVLSDFQITIPEIGTLRATKRPLVIITSNRTREIHDALKRRCLYHWIDYPSFEKEYRILLTKVPAINHTLAQQICSFMQQVRGRDFFKKPGIAETLDWANALIHLHREHLDRPSVEETLGCILKHFEDIKKMREADLESCLGPLGS
jgi:MoxR-like ATPase